MKALQVRPATESDLEVLVRFNLAMARETEAKELDPVQLRSGMLRALRDPSRGHYTVVELEGEVVGSLMVTREWSDWRDGWFWWIQSVYDAPQARRLGVYSALHREVLSAAAAAGGVCGVRLYVEVDNAVARSTYERLGMHESRYRLYEVEVERAPERA